MIFNENRLPADDSHEISYLIFSKIGKDVNKLSSAAVMIGTLRVNNGCTLEHLANHIECRARSDCCLL